MNIYLINETPSDIQVHEPAKSVTIHPNAARMFDISTTGKLSLDKRIVITRNDDDTVSTTDDDCQLSGIGGEFWQKYAVPDGADFAFAIVPPGEGDGADDEVSLADHVIANLSSHGFTVTEIEAGIFMAKDGRGIHVMIREKSQGIQFQSGIETRKLSEADLATLLVYMNAFNRGSLLTKAFMLHAEFTAVSFESWFPPAYSDEVFENYFSLYLNEIAVSFDEDLREKMNTLLLR